MLKTLQPNSTAPRREQYDLAWNALLNKPEDYNPQQRAHAKCWLTYRTVDGEVSLTDWLMKVEPVEIPAINDRKTALRWKLSQWTAEVYLMILNRQKWEEKAYEVAIAASVGAMEDYAGTTTNCMRISALYAYNLHLCGKDKDANAWARSSMESWVKSWGSFNLSDNPLRFAELPADAAPLHVLMSIYRQDLAPRPWADKLIHDSAASVWGKCMDEISRNPRRLW